MVFSYLVSLFKWDIISSVHRDCFNFIIISHVNTLNLSVWVFLSFYFLVDFLKVFSLWLTFAVNVWFNQDQMKPLRLLCAWFESRNSSLFALTEPSKPDSKLRFKIRQIAR